MLQPVRTKSADLIITSALIQSDPLSVVCEVFLVSFSTFYSHIRGIYSSMIVNPSIILLLIWSAVCFSDEHECRTVARMLPPPISAGNDIGNKTVKDHKKIYENVEINYR